MKEIRDIYYWDVADELIAGKTVYVVDKIENESFCVNNLATEEYFDIVRLCKDTPKRFAFWVVTEVEEQNEQ